MAKQKRLTEKQKNRILADYVLLGSYNAAAKKNKCSPNTVKRLVLARPEDVAGAAEGKNACARDILSYMEGQRDAVCSIIGKGLEALMNPDMMANATPNQITTAIGTLIDKWAMIEERRQSKDGGGVRVEMEQAFREGAE